MLKRRVGTRSAASLPACLRRAKFQRVQPCQVHRVREACRVQRAAASSWEPTEPLHLEPKPKRSTICYVLVVCIPPVRGAYTRAPACLRRAKFQRVQPCQVHRVQACLVQRAAASSWKTNLTTSSWAQAKIKEYDWLCPRCVQSTPPVRGAYTRARACLRRAKLQRVQTCQVHRVQACLVQRAAASSWEPT